jgi:ATP-dependent helicase/nuclease subunit A
MNQPDASSPLPHLLIRASAGTGKTFQLTNRFLQLLRHGVGCDQILATTFTRKAAGEILDRVILRLAEAAVDSNEREQLRRWTGGGEFTHDDCLAVLQSVLQRLHRLRIGTMDSFFAQVARSFSLELGLPPGWQIVDPLVDSRLRRDAIHRVLGGGDTSDLRTLLHLLTKGEATRGISPLIRDTVDGLYPLYLSTPLTAWQQLPRFKSLDAAALAQTIEALRHVPLPTKRMQTARDADGNRALRGDWDGFLSTGLAKKIVQGQVEFFSKPIPEAIVSIYRRLIDHCRAQLVGRVALQTEASYRLLAQFHLQYVDLKQRQRAMCFEDVTRCLAELQGTLDWDRLILRMDSHLDHLLLDEFQDTSPEQWRVLKPLAQHVTTAPQASFFCVGDLKQAIYGWRGGVAEIFDAIDRQLNGLQSQSMNVSYRSSPAVIETVNRVFSRIMDHPNLRQAEGAVRRWCQEFETHETACSDRPGYAQLQTTPLADGNHSQRDVTLDFAARQIAELTNQAPGRSIGVLVRKNQTVGQLIFLLRRHQVRASEEGGNPLTDSAAVLNVLSALRMADHPGDTVACFHLAHSPLGQMLGIEDPRDREQASDAAARIRHRLVIEGYGPTIQDWASRLSLHCNPREWNRLQQLVNMAGAYDRVATLRADDFIDFVRSTRVADPMPADVRVMTIHQAKGIEFDIVVLPELDADLIGQPESFVMDRPDVMGPIRRVCRYANQRTQELMPHAIQQMFAEAKQREVHESLCVLYVALTRAAHALHMIVPPANSNEKLLPRTFAGLLRIALGKDGSAAEDSVLYRRGDLDWHARCPSTDPSMRKPCSPTAGSDVEPVRIRLADSAGPARRGWERIRPSGLAGDFPVRIEDLMTIGSDSPARLQGRLMHKWFEQITWIEDPLPDDRHLHLAAREILSSPGSPRLNLARSMQRFRELLAAPCLQAMLSRTRYSGQQAAEFPAAVTGQFSGGGLVAKVHNERGFAFYEQDQLVQGFIDRLVLLYREDRVVAAEILDYKTDIWEGTRPETFRDKATFYAPQIQAYRLAVARLTGLAVDRIAAQLIFLHGPFIVPFGP